MERRKDYYVVLGVPRDSDSETVRAAFRRRALEYHPDRAGEDGATRFRDALEAYEVLSDPDRRRRYDDERIPVRVAVRESAEPIFGIRQVDAEPLIPESRFVHDRRVPESVSSVGPPAEALFDRVLRNLTQRGIPKSESSEPSKLHLRVLVRVSAWRAF
jgi:curved DNA-binding protein CbpA